MLAERLRQVLSERHLSWQECAESADIPLETMRNLYYGKVKDPKVSTLLSLSHVLHVSVNWLMGEIISTSEEAELLFNYRRCGRHGKSVLQQIAKYEAYTALAEREASGKHSIPCIVPNDLFCEGSKYGATQTKEVYTTDSNAFLALYVPNNNWAPKLCKYDTILLKDKFPLSGENALFSYQGNIYFRKYIETEKGYILRCINERHEDLVFKRMDDPSLICIGTAIGLVRE